MRLMGCHRFCGNEAASQSRTCRAATAALFGRNPLDLIVAAARMASLIIFLIGS